MITTKLSDRDICLILERKDPALTSFYLQKLYTRTNIKPDNVTISTIYEFPQSLAKFDVLIFDIESSQLKAIKLIEKISFNGDIVVFISQEKEAEVRSALNDRITDVVVKPIDWNELKDKAYFS